MGKIILLALGLLAAWWILRAYRRRIDRPGPAAPPAGESMVRCALCGLHLPASESVAARELHFCSVEHRDQHGGASRSS